MPRIVDHDDKLNLNLSELPDNKEDFQLIWLDAHFAKSSDTRATQKMLRLLNTNAQFYTDVDKCLEIILNIQAEHVLLVVSGSLAHIILPRLESIRSVRAIFIFCETSELHSNLLHEYPRKIVDIYTDRDVLLKSIADAMKLIEKQDMAFRLFDCKQRSTRDLTKESASFLWNQLLIDVLRKMPTNDQAKNEMLDYCSAYYRNNREELKKIESFRTSYTPNDAIKYYTADSFLYKLLNKALRTEDIRLLYTFRFFIIDMCAQLDDGKKTLVEKESGSLILYRGQQIPEEEFENLKNNVGSLIATNGFLSTSRDEKVSFGFSKLPLSHLDENMIQVQMTIKADPTTLKKVTFADITHQSEFELEREVLFSLGAVFRIDKCEFDETFSMGKLLLTATDEGSATLQSYLDAQKHQLQIYTPLIYFGRLLMNEMNEIDRAREYFQMLLKTLPSDHPDIADVYNQIGVVHYMNAQKLFDWEKDSKLSQALEMFEKALKMRQNIYGDNDIRLASSFNNIGSVYNDREEFDRALENYQHALQIIENSTVEGSIFKANLLWNCGVLKERMYDVEAALSFYIKADDFYSQFLPMHHPTHIKSASGISRLWKELGNIHEALKYYERIFEFCEAMLLPSHPQYKNSWIDIVRCSLELGCEQEAIIYLNRVLKMCERDSSCMKKTSNVYVQSMAKLSEDALKFELALNYYKILFQSDTTKIDDFLSMKSIEDDIDDDEETSSKYIEILKFRLSAYEQLFPKNDTQYASFLMDVGKVFDSCNSTDLAYQCYQKALNIHESTTMCIDTNGFRVCWTKLIDIYFAKNDKRSVLNLLERALKKSKPFSDNHLTEIQCLKYIADKYEENNDIPNALHYLEKALRHIEITKSHQHIHPLLEKFLKFYKEEGQEQIIETYIQRAVDVYEKDPIELSKCYWLLHDWCKINDMKDKALKYYEYFSLATEQNHSSSTEILDKTWIDFALINRSENFRFGPIGESMELESLMQICHQRLPSLHFKNAIILWKCGALHETIKMTSAALDFYLSATESFEKLIYNQNDTRTKQALNYLLSRKYACVNASRSCLWLKSSKLSHLAMFSAASSHEKWKCILQRLKMLKMNHVNNQWEFHLTIGRAVLDYELCAILLEKMLEVCNDQTHSDESNTSLDIHSVICCFEFISHWYFAKDRPLQSLLFRQFQLELESKIFNDHSHVAWSLWFIGLIFQKTKEYDLSLGYLNRALKIFEHLHSKEHSNIQKLEECISHVKEMVCTAHSSQINKSLMKMITEQQVKCMPQMLQMSFHID